MTITKAGTGMSVPTYQNATNVEALAVMLQEMQDSNREAALHRRDILLQEVADIEKRYSVEPTTRALRQAWHEGRVIPREE